MTYDRNVLVEVITYHRKVDIKDCMCGWAELGKDHSKHVADVYEQAVAGRACPMHGISDCSPILNGCSRLTTP